jgi:uncharacterized membrane protein YgcG
MDRWLFLASDYAACIRDTRALALKHGLVWFSSIQIAPPLPGDRLLLAFKLPRQRLFVPLAKFVVEAREARGLETTRGKTPTLAELPEDLRGDFQDAARGSGHGTGYNTRGRTSNPVLCVATVDSFDEVWSGGSGESGGSGGSRSGGSSGPGPHWFPDELKFGLAEDAELDRPYVVRFSPDLLSAPLLPGRFHP